MSLWDRMANLQDLFWKKDGATQAEPIYNSQGYVKYGIAQDISKNLPAGYSTFYVGVQDGKETLNNPSVNPNLNTKIEQGRQTAISGIGAAAQNPLLAIGGGAAIGRFFGPAGAVGGALLGSSIYGIGRLDEATDGKLSTALMSGTKGVRSNYAFLREAVNANASYGLLAGLSQIGGAIAGGLAAIGVGAAAGSVVPGIGTVVGGLAAAGSVLGLYGGGKAARALSESGVFGNELQQAAVFAQSPEGQEKYNIGRDIVRSAGRITGSKTLQNTDIGIGAVTSGLINFFTEVTLAPDIKATQVVGKTGRAATIGGITTAKQGIIGGQIQKAIDTPEKIQARLAADVQLIKRTANGEKTIYSPMFEFINKNDAATVKMRTEFAMGDEVSHMAAQLMAGKSYSEISLLLRVGRGDSSAIQELATKHKATYAQLIRAESALNRFETKSLPSTSKNKYIKQSLKDKQKILNDELQDMAGKNSELAKSLRLDSALQERTVSIFPIIEKRRNDVAKQKIANKLGINKTDLTERETLTGKISQRIYQDNTFGAIVRSIERMTDDAPHSTVNFNDVLQSTGRVRATIREGVQRNIFTKDEVVDLYNKFINAKFEGDKLKYVDDFTKQVIERVGKKYGIEGAPLNLVLNSYLKRMKTERDAAVSAARENRAYMIDPKTQEVINDPVLVSQLANGSYLPDIKLIDNAFKQFRKRQNKEFGGIVNTGMTLKWLNEEYNSLWRNFTLFRVGYPINITRDNTLRIAADGQWFNVVKEFTKDAIDDFSNFNNSVGKIKRWTKGVVDKKYSIKETRKELKLRIAVLSDAEKSLREYGYDINKPPKKIKPEAQKTLDYYNNVKANVVALQQRESQLLSAVPTKIVGRKSVAISNYSFNDYREGIYGRITMNKIRGKEDIRGLLESNRELQLAAVRRDRTGGTWIQPTLKNEDVHLRSWEQILVNTLPSDPVAMKIMKGVPKKEIIKYIKSVEFRDKLDAFGYVAEKNRALRSSDASYIYNRVEAAVNQFAPDIKLQKLVAEGKVNATVLKQMYPDVVKRPGVNTDMALDLLGQSTFVKTMNKFTRDVVAWLATAPTSKLAYNPYYKVSYEQKLQSMVAVANAQGRKLSTMEQTTFEANARAYAYKELKTKLNAFNRDANYPELINYIFAFFPAFVEQYRVYARIIAENPEFLLKTAQMRAIPERLGEVQVDPNGEEYVEVTLPLLGDNIKGRLSTSWFNPFNPTGGNILSTSAQVSAITNEILKRGNVELPKLFEEIIVPFGVQKDSFTAMTPTTIKRLGQAFSAFTNENAPQLNKDIAMIMENKLFEFRQNNHRSPNDAELNSIYNETKFDGKALSLIRFFGSGLLPQQPRYVSPLQWYSDELRRFQEELGGSEGTDKFLEKYPDYFLVVDKLTDATSGIYADKTSQQLVKNNSDLVQQMIARMGSDGDLRTLGAVFNDEDYAFSSSAQAWLQTKNIPGTNKTFIGSQTALENSRSSLVNEGWRNWTKLKDVVSRMLLQNNPPYDPAKGYGKSIMDAYKNAYLEKMKTDNKLWWDEKQDRDSSASLKNVVDNLTMAANNEKLWADLSKQARWHSIVEYLNFRYYIKDKLDQRRTAITSDRVVDVRAEVDSFVLNLRQNDINFGKFYDRYFDGDDFKYVAD